MSLPPCYPTTVIANTGIIGSDGASRELNGVDPLAWLTDVLQRIVAGQTKNQELHTLLPWNWRPRATIPAA